MKTLVIGDDDTAGTAHLRSMLELLLLEDSFLPLMMNWAAEEGWSDLILFLLETDSLRFPSILMNEATKNHARFIQDPSALSRISKSYIAESDTSPRGVKVGHLLSYEKLGSVARLTSCGIPLAAVFSVICDRTWQKIMRLGENLPSKKFVWSALQKSIVGDKKLELITVLKKESYRIFLINFLQQSPAEGACLKCCLQVRSILDALEQFKFPSSRDQLRGYAVESKDHLNSTIEYSCHMPESGTQNHRKASSESCGDPTVVAVKRKGSFFAIRRVSITAPKSIAPPSSIAVRGGGDNLVSFAAPGTPIDAAASITSQTERGEDYSDPLGAFALLLLETRKLHRKFFSTSGSVAPFPTQASRGSDYGNMSHSSINSINSQPTHKGGMESPSGSNSSSSFHNIPCAGPSETLRLELTATLAQTSSVHLADVDTLESLFTMTFAGRLEKLLSEVERETFQYLQLRFPHFLNSPEYVFLVAQEKAEESKKVKIFRSMNNFLDFVKENNESPVMNGKSLNEMSVFNFETQEPELKQSIHGKVYVHHEDSYVLHLNQYGSFCKDDDVSDSESDVPDKNKMGKGIENDVIPVRRKAVGRSGSNTQHPSYKSIHPTGVETLADLYPSLGRNAAMCLSPSTKENMNPFGAHSHWESDMVNGLQAECKDSYSSNSHMSIDQPVGESKSSDYNTNYNNYNNDNNNNNDNNSNGTVNGGSSGNRLYNVIGERERGREGRESEGEIMTEDEREREDINTAFQLTFAVNSLSPRVCVQLAMVLSSKMSVVLVSSSTELLTATISTLPHLVKPMRLSASHSVTQLTGVGDVDNWWNAYLTSYHLALASRQNSKDNSHYHAAVLGSNSSSGIRDLKSATHGSALRKSHLVCATSLDFYSSQMLKDFCFSDCKCANDVCVYDLDTFTVISPQERKVFTLGPPAESKWMKDLLCSKTFQCYNSPAFRSLHIETCKLLDRLKRKSSQAQKRNKKNSSEKLTRESGKTQRNGSQLLGKILEVSVSEIEKSESINCLQREVVEISSAVMDAFSRYFTAIFYHALPASILYYPTQKVVACDLQLLQSHLFAARERVRFAEIAQSKKKILSLSRPVYAASNAPESARSSPMHIPLYVCPVSPRVGEHAHMETGNISNSDRHEESGTNDHGSSSAVNGVGRGGGSGMGENRGLMQRHFTCVDDTDKAIENDSGKSNRLSLPLPPPLSYKAHIPPPVETPDLPIPERVCPFRVAQRVEESFSHLIVTSPAFFDLVKRHGPVLQHFRF